MTKNLMIFAIGPVQEFIATARRSRDLWYGSWMLSELSKAAAKRIVELSGELIFPSPPDPGSLDPASKFTSPNKIVAILEGEPKVLAEDKGAGIHKSVRDRLDELWMDARSHANGAIADDVAEAQIKELLEFYWVSVPLEEAGDYGKAREQAEALMAARKATRNFEQPKRPSNAPKSSLDGARESVIPKEAYPERGSPQELQAQKVNDLYLNFHARRGEQLSGVDLLKRLGNPDKSPKFPSTSDMAGIPYIQALDADGGKGRELLEKIKALLPKETDKLDRAEEGLIFESRLKDAFPLQELPGGIKEKFREYLKGLPTPNPYYALLAADGDFMGKVIDGLKTKEDHREISGALAKFSLRALDIVEGSRGVPIYSGGDDVLAYLPLNAALKCAQELESAFGEELGKFFFEQEDEKRTPTLSVGIAIVHHLEPLSDALELARQAEREAKGVKGKNGLAVILSKRSGADRIIRGKFRELYERLRELKGFFDDKAISGGAAYELLELHRALSGSNIPPEGKAAEAVRIVKRKRESGGENKVTDDVLDTFKTWIKGVKDQQDSDYTIPPIPLNDLAYEMIVAKNLASAKEAE